MGVPAWLHEEFLDYKRRVYARKSQVREAAAAAGGGSVAARSGPNRLLFLVPFFLLSVAGLGYLMIMKQSGFGQGSLVVTKLKGTVRVEGEYKNWELSRGMRLRPGQKVVCGRSGAVELRGSDPDTRLLVFEGSSFQLSALQEVRDKQFLLEGAVDAGEVMFDFRSETSLWGVDIRLPTGVRCVSKRVVMFKLRVRDEGCRLVVGDGIVATLGPGGEKGFVRADQMMRSTDSSPLGKPEGLNVLTERWNL